MRSPGKPLHERIHYATKVAKLFNHPLPEIRAMACHTLGTMSCAGDAFAWKVARPEANPYRFLWNLTHTYCPEP
jgi:hypothetical protein